MGENVCGTYIKKRNVRSTDKKPCDNKIDKKSSKGLASIEINEEELISVLKGENLNKQEKVQESTGFLFTF